MKTRALGIPAAARRVLRPLAAEAAKEGAELYAVGGCVRDWLLGIASQDLDLVVKGDPAPVAGLCAEMFGGKPQAFDRFGTLRVLGPDRWRVDFATSRREAYPKPASLPVVKPAPLRADVFRRDFTINAMAVRLHPDREGELLDYCGGLKDLRAKIVRPLHRESFRDDPTRVFRAARFLCRFGFKPAPGMLPMVKEALKRGYAALLSRHRLTQELLRVLGEKDPACALNLLRDWGYLRLIHPKLHAPPRELRLVEERLGALALALGPAEGAKFLGSLPVERGLALELQEVLKLAWGQASPRRRLSALSRRLLRCKFPRLASGALEPLYLNGDDLKAAGVPVGKGFSEIMDAAAKAQWSGEISSRGDALRWLRGRQAPISSAAGVRRPSPS